MRGPSGLAPGTIVFFVDTPAGRQCSTIFLTTTPAEQNPILVSFFETFTAAIRAEFSMIRADAAMEAALANNSSIQTRLDNWKQVHIPEDQKRQLIVLAELFLDGDVAAPRGTLLHGPSGTGKTLIARTISNTIGCKFFNLSVPDLKAGFHGQSGQLVRGIWNQAREAGKAVIFIDECEGIFAKRGGLSSDKLTEELVQAFLAEWDGLHSNTEVWVIGATNRRDLMDPAILSRFGGNEFRIDLPGPQLRREILAGELSRAGMDGLRLPANIGELTQGMSGRDLHNLPGRIKILSHPRPATAAHLLEVLSAKRGPGASHVDLSATWDTLIIDDELKNSLKDICAMLKHAEILSSKGISLPRGLLLQGPAGTGKTQVARTLAVESGLHFVHATTADMKAGYTGQSGQMVKDVFERARAGSPAILFLDEVDIIAPIRGTGDSFTEEIVGQLLQELDGIAANSAHVFVIAATNCPESIDSAILSRFPQTAEIPLPTLSDRKRILAVLLQGKPATVSDSTIARLAKNTDGQSGSVSGIR